MAKKNMNDRLKNLKEEKESASLPAEEKIVIKDGEEMAGTKAKVDEELDLDDDAPRPKPLPKKNRRGGKAVQAELEAAKEAAQGNKEKYTRLLAEFDNMRARNEKENSEMADKGSMETMKKILPVIDNLERALETVPAEDKTPFEEGVQKIYKQLMDTLEGIGIVPMDAVDKEFDPTYHNAVIHVEDENLGENIVVEEMQKGYMYKEAVLRHAMVKVAN